MEKFKSGFVAVIGKTNVGKSSIINRLVGEKISAIANKPQTTRTRIRFLRYVGIAGVMWVIERRLK